MANEFTFTSILLVRKLAHTDAKLPSHVLGGGDSCGGGAGCGGRGALTYVYPTPKFVILLDLA